MFQSAIGQRVDDVIEASWAVGNEHPHLERRDWILVDLTQKSSCSHQARDNPFDVRMVPVSPFHSPISHCHECHAARIVLLY